MRPRASLVVAFALSSLATFAPLACRSRVTLGDPDGGIAIGVPAEGSVDASPRCPGVASRASLTTVDDSLGELRSIAVAGGKVFVLFARTNGGSVAGVLATVPTSGGALTDLAVVGTDPVALALSADGSFAFVASRGSSQIYRVDASGSVVVGAAGGVPSAIVADANAGAVWTVPANDSLVAWSFTTGTPAPIATTPQPAALARVLSTLYVRGARTVSAFDPTRDAAPRVVSPHCTAGAPAIDNQALYCTDGEAIARIDVATGNATVLAAAQPGASDVVVGAGRVFWRAAQSPQQSLVMTIPLDGIGGPTVIEGIVPSADPLLLAFEGCDLYFNAGREIIRVGL